MKKSKIWKIVGGVIGIASVCAIVPACVVSCGSSISTASQPTTTTNTTNSSIKQKTETTPTSSSTDNTTKSKTAISSKSDSTPISSSSTSSSKNTTPSSQATGGPTTTQTPAPYELAPSANTSTIAYRNPTNDMSMIASNNISNYGTLINEPNNVIISVLGEPEAVINVANDVNNTNTNTVPNITLNLNPQSTLYQQCYDRTNNTTDLTSLSNLITFSTTKQSDKSYNFVVNNMAQGAPTNSSWTFSLLDFQPAFFQSSNNTVTEIGTINLGSISALAVDTGVNTFWNDIHNSKPTATFTSPNQLDLANGKQVPFDLTIDLLPFVQYIKTPTTIQITNPKTGVWESKNMPASTSGIFDNNGTWWLNNPSYANIKPPKFIVPKTNDKVNYMYIDDGMIYVGTATVKS